MDKYFCRALQLASLGGNAVFPNPQVGAVIGYQDRIIGEGYHSRYGQAHAEVQALTQVSEPEILKQSRMYVSLEPCSHHGKTPPCTEQIIRLGISEVFVGCLDPNPLVAGNGIRQLRAAGIHVQLARNPEPFLAINSGFFSAQLLQRPYLILKWAETADNYIGIQNQRLPVSGKLGLIWGHRLRASVHAVMIGATTARIDNPQLNIRHYYAPRNPVRIILDPDLSIDSNCNLLDGSETTIIVNSHRNHQAGSTTWWVPHDTEQPVIRTEFYHLATLIQNLYHQFQLTSILVEGGTQLLQQFLNSGLFDEIYILKSTHPLQNIHGIAAPIIPPGIPLIDIQTYDSDRVLHYRSTSLLNKYLQTVSCLL